MKNKSIIILILIILGVAIVVVNLFMVRIAGAESGYLRILYGGDVPPASYVRVFKDERMRVICYTYREGIDCLTEKEIKEGKK